MWRSVNCFLQALVDPPHLVDQRGDAVLARGRRLAERQDEIGKVVAEVAEVGVTEHASTSTPTSRHSGVRMVKP